MNAAIFYSGKYGSTAQYAHWIGEATGIPVFDIKDPDADPLKYEYLILGSSIIFFKLTIRKWARSNASILKGRSKILFSVSGAGPSDNLERWVAASFPATLLSQMQHVALRGRLDHSKLPWWFRKFMWVGSLFNADPQASKEERYGFDYVDKESIAPILKTIQRHQETQATN